MSIEKYRNNFLKEVEENVEEGHWVKMCMQCGVCAGSCPLGPHWAHPPQEIFMMIRAGKREEVLTSDSMWMCTSCYNCIVRCPRKLPITHIMHGLANYANRLGLSPKNQPTQQFAPVVLEQPGQDRPRQRAEAVPGHVFQGRLCSGHQERHGDAERRPGHGEGQAPEPDGDVSAGMASRTRAASMPC